MAGSYNRDSGLGEDLGVSPYIENGWWIVDFFQAWWIKGFLARQDCDAAVGRASQFLAGEFR